ncbi:MAG TPA: response regulator [Thermoanaerobaculia bacterium]
MPRQLGNRPPATGHPATGNRQPRYQHESCCARSAEVVKAPNETGILVVEDDPAIRRLVRMVLQRRGYQVETAEDGVEAVLKLGIGEYDAIILDLMMPNLDGFVLIDTLAANDPARLQKIIVTSAASPAVIQARMRGKPFDILPKPFDIEELQRRVRACVEQES